jgi:hypothetical protein
VTLYNWLDRWVLPLLTSCLWMLVEEDRGVKEKVEDIPCLLARELTLALCLARRESRLLVLIVRWI